MTFDLDFSDLTFYSLFSSNYLSYSRSIYTSKFFGVAL